MKQNILIAIAVGLFCCIIGFQAGRSGMMPKEDFEKYRQKVQEGNRDYKRHYFASRENISELFDYIDAREQLFCRDMPDSLKSGPDNQCVVDLFGNIETWKKENYTERTKDWDAQVRDIEARIASATPY